MSSFCISLYIMLYLVDTMKTTTGHPLQTETNEDFKHNPSECQHHSLQSHIYSFITGNRILKVLFILPAKQWH